MSLFARVAWLIVAGFVAVELIVHAMAVHDRLLAGARAYAISAVDRTLALRTLVTEASAAERERLFAAASGPDFAVALRSDAPNVAGEDWRHAREIEEAIAQHLASLALSVPLHAVVFEARANRVPRPALQIATPIGEGAYLVATATQLDRSRDHGFAFASATLTGFVVLLVLWGARRSLRHVPRFAAAAEALGQDIAAPPLPISGPREVRKAAAAFNDMARRMREQLDERTQMLAAVSHDVRTWLTRLVLRVEHGDDPAQRERARKDIAEMAALLDDVVVFVREQRADEPRVRLDIATLVQTLIDDEASLGRAASYAGPDHAVIEGRPRALRRALTNLIDNALRYGSGVELLLIEEEVRVIVEVADRGPGIPANERARMLKPFERLESSRSQETGGTGLGLAIAHTVVAGHDGTIELLDRAGGGLIVRVVLPRSANPT